MMLHVNEICHLSQRWLRGIVSDLCDSKIFPKTPKQLKGLNQCVQDGLFIERMKTFSYNPKMYYI